MNLRPLIAISSKQALFFAVFLVMYEFIVYMANDMIMPGMLTVVRTFHAPESHIATSLTAYVLGGASLQLLLGPISDAYGRRPVMLFGAGLFFVCTIVIACSFSIDQFLVARFFQGMGLCFISVIGYATLQEIFAEMDAVRLVAIMANVSISAPLVGPLLGAVVINYTGWRLIFVGIGLIALVAWWGLWRFMPESVGQTKNNGEKILRIAFSSRTILANYVTLLSNRRFLLATVAHGLLNIPCVAWIALAPVIMVSDARLSVIQYGIWQIPVFSAAIAGNWILHYWTHRKTLHQILTLGSMLIGMSLFAMVGLTWYSHASYLGLMPGIIGYFLALGITHAPLDRLILFSTPVSKGMTSALMTMMSMSIQAIGIEFANRVYLWQKNQYFAFYCLAMGLLYGIFMVMAFRGDKSLGKDAL